MTRVLSKTIGMLVAISILCTHQLSAYCSRCVKIEEERAKEQSEHPQTLGYYDDQISLHSEEQHFSDLPFKEEFFEESDVPQPTPSDPAKQKSQQLKNGYSEDKNNTPIVNPHPSYSSLLTILKTKHFLETLDGSFTLLVPSNEALRSLPAGTLVELTRPENQEKLAALVSNHVIARKILRKDFETYRNREIKAISGRNLTIQSENGNLTIDEAKILRIEPAGYDGVIYIIDRVLLP
jgi:uncharacterized surface protein with fasciclin (FAS1) repeats